MSSSIIWETRTFTVNLLRGAVTPLPFPRIKVNSSRIPPVRLDMKATCQP
jgi:hypothetical protein